AWLGGNLQPPLRAGFYIGVVSLRLPAVMPVAGCRRCRLGLHEFLLDIDWRCRWRIAIAVTTISITPITRPISSSRVPIPVSVARRIIGGRSCPGTEAVAQHTHAKR